MKRIEVFEKAMNEGGRALTAIEPGKLVWMDFKTFKNARIADDWICDYCRKNGYSITDFNLVRREA